MPKTFYTEQDIEALVRGGTRSLALNDDVVLTEQAYEAARRLGLALIHDRPSLPPSAPIRPYLSSIPKVKNPVETQNPAPPPPARVETQNLASLPPQPQNPAPSNPATPTAERIRAAVIARLGDSIDPQLLNTIIHRVLNSTGVK
jgi:hypothetical protein